MRLSIWLFASMMAFATLARAEGPVVMFDQGHGQRFLIEKPGDLSLSALAATFAAAGAEVKSTGQDLLPHALEGVKVVVTSGAFVPHKPQEVQALYNFVKNGGSLAVMMHIAPTYSKLLSAFRVAGASGVVHETENVVGVESTDFNVVNFNKEHPLFAGVASFAAHGAWGVTSNSKEIVLVAETSKGAWIDLNRNKIRDEKAEPLNTLGIVAAGQFGKGKVVIFGDDAIFQEKFLVEGNKKLAENMARWLTSEDK